MSTTLSIQSIIADDVVALFEFYRAVFELDEVVERRSAVFRGLDLGGIIFGLVSPMVYEAHQMQAWADPTGAKQYMTFEVGSDDEVVERTAIAVSLGAQIVQDAHETHYESFQTVVADPEANIFRINHFR